MMAELKGTVHINTDRCKGCGLCTVVCPADILLLNEEKVNVKGYRPVWVRKPNGCTGCGNCALMCPDSVITVKRFSRKRRAAHV
jgi:2-oxoglutarate ferredoxin oxidoreductase subunit delta